MSGNGFMKGVRMIKKKKIRNEHVLSLAILIGNK